MHINFFIIFFCMITNSIIAEENGVLNKIGIIHSEEVDEELTIVDSVGQEEIEEEEIADRDRDIPTLYDRNRIDLMHKRDRELRKKGICHPPPDVIQAPKIYAPTPGSQVTR